MKDEKPKSQLDTQLERTGKTFCTHQCSAEYRKRERARWSCEWCGASLVETDRRCFCSDSCERIANGSWSDSTDEEEVSLWIPGRSSLPFNGSLWRRMRKLALDRDSRECRSCGMREEAHLRRYGHQLHVHHWTPRRGFETAEEAHRLENLVTLCAGCHGKIERGEEAADRAELYAL